MIGYYCHHCGRRVEVPYRFLHPCPPPQVLVVRTTRGLVSTEAITCRTCGSDFVEEQVQKDADPLAPLYHSRSAPAPLYPRAALALLRGTDGDLLYAPSACPPLPAGYASLMPRARPGV